MANKNHGGLGKGLGALLQNTQLESVASSASAEDAIQKIPVKEIQANRYQPRQEFDESAMEELSESIRSYGVLQPVLVRKLPQGGYELIAGERRLRAARQADVAEIPAIVRELNDAQISEVALIENVQREDLNIMEEAQAYERLMKDFGHTQEALAKKIGRSRSHIANILRMLRLAPEVQAYVANGMLSMGQAKPLLALESFERQIEAADIIQSRELSSRQSEALVKRMLAEPQAEAEGDGKDAEDQAIYVREAEDRLTEILGTQVKIIPGKKKNRIQIDFYSEEDLSRIVESLTAKRPAMSKDERIEALRRFSSSKNFNV